MSFINDIDQHPLIPLGVRHDLICPDCNSKMLLSRSTLGNGWFYRCERHPECDNTHGAHADGAPLGYPANRATRDDRIQAHAVFDAVWKSGTLSRPQAYCLLQVLMKLSKDQAHIAMFDSSQCQQLIRKLSCVSGRQLRKARWLELNQNRAQTASRRIVGG